MPEKFSGMFRILWRSAVKSRVYEIDILLIHFVLCQTKSLAETLEMDDFSGPQKTYDVVDIRVV